MIKNRPTTSVEPLDALLSANAELLRKVAMLQEDMVYRETVLIELQARLNRYWDLHEDVDYRRLVDRIREEARSVGEILRALDSGTRRKLARFGDDRYPALDHSTASGKSLLPSVSALLQTLDEWK